MEKYLILYHSGTGNTKLVATLLYEKLKSHINIEMISIENVSDISILSNYDGFIFGFPTYHTSPSTSMQEFIKKASRLVNNKKAFIFTTCGLYSANTLRAFSKYCISINITVFHHRTYHCPASDGTLIAPGMDIWFKFEKNIIKKINKDVQLILKGFNSRLETSSVPRFKLYSILNYPNKILGQQFKPKIHLIPERCTKCGKCINKCPNKCMIINEKGLPEHTLHNCEHCYRCIHNCPKQALSLKRKTPVKRQLDETFFTKELTVMLRKE